MLAESNGLVAASMEVPVVQISVTWGPEIMWGTLLVPAIQCVLSPVLSDDKMVPSPVRVV